MADAIAVTLRFVHILFGIAWIGAVFFSVGVLRRAMPRVEMAARKATMKQLLPVVTQYIPGAAAMTIITGAIFYAYLSGLSTFVLFETAWGLALLLALGLALATFAFGLLFGVRSGKLILQHFEEEQCTHGPEVGALQKRFNQSQLVVLALGLAIIAIMVLASHGGL